MEEKNLYQLAEFVLPSDILHYFSIVKIEPDSSLLRIYLDEKMEKELSEDLHFRTGKSFSLPLQIDITASGTRYSKEFGAFLKETYGDVPSDLPYA